MVQKKLKAIDLFSGAGGLSLGLSRAGLEVVGAVDFSTSALGSYRRNFSHVALEADISKLSPAELCARLSFYDELDLLAGGPPCQGFSIQRIGEDKDDRNDLILEFARFVKGLRPKVFVMENVTGLLGRRGIQSFIAFKLKVIRCGYQVRHTVIDAADFGVPQHRKRVIVFGWRNDLPSNLPFPEPTHVEGNHVTVRDAIGDLPSPSFKDAVGPGADQLHFRTKLSQLNIERLSHIRPGKGFEDLPNHLRVNCHKSGAERIGHRYVYGRLSFDDPSGTITARFDSFTRGKFAHPVEDRNITLREGARLQSFPDDFVFLGTQEEIASQIGNAVPPQIAFRIGVEVRDYLNKAHAIKSAETSLSFGEAVPDANINMVDQPTPII